MKGSTTVAAAACMAFMASTPVHARCFRGGAKVVFNDMHDGDMKEIEATAEKYTIRPYNNTESWEIKGEFDDKCVAQVDFNVPGKPGPPPVNLTMTYYDLESLSNEVRAALEFTDKSGTLAPPTQPLNLWISDTAHDAALSSRHHSASLLRCIDTPQIEYGGLQMFDMKDGDSKVVAVNLQNQLDIQPPPSSSESWHVTSLFNSVCEAEVDFRVPGKPNPPPCAITGTAWPAVSGAGTEKTFVIFTDPMGTLAPPTTLLNAWTAANDN